MKIPDGRNPLLDRLPLLPGGVTVRQFSSHSRQGINRDNDGVLYTDEHGHAVIFDVHGPGCIRSMWSTEIPDDQVYMFYFDGEVTPRYEISARQFFQGKHPLFPGPLNCYEKLGYWGHLPYAGNSFAPIPFQDGLKIAVKGPRCFYHIIFETYPYGTEIRTFTGDEDRTALLQAFSSRSDVTMLAHLNVKRTECEQLAPGQHVVLLDEEGAGTVRAIIIEADGSEAFLSDAYLHMRWDDAALLHVNCPIGHFFASPLRAETVNALPVQTELLDNGRVRLTCFFPMPYWQKADIRLINRSGHMLGSVRADVYLSAHRYPAEKSGYFCTHYRAGQTDYGRDWLFFSGPGTGLFIGAVQTMHGDHYCEGDEHFTLDGACSPQIHGTGSEDYYLACFWPNRHFTFPFAGSVGDVFRDGGGHFPGAYRYPGRYYRFHLEAPIPFYRSADLRIQHGGENNIQSDYTSLAFLYMRPEPVLQQTDFIAVGNTASEALHDYEATACIETEPVAGRFQGDLLHFRERLAGRRHRGGEIAFTAAIDPENNGVRLRRRLDAAVGRQRAAVYVDGKFAGTWYDPDHNPHLRWYDSDFDIHPRFTRGKQRLTVRLVLCEGDVPTEFTDFQYTVFSFAA